jgi:hypothetical protein
MFSEGGRMKRLLCFLIGAILAVAADVDVTGKWSGSFNGTNPNGETRESNALLMLKQSGTDITGTVGPNEEEQFVIQKGKIDGDKITLEVDHQGHTMTFSLVLAAGRITGGAEMSTDGQTMKAKIDVTRAK